MLPPVASVPSPPTLQPAPQHLGDEMAHGHTGGWLLAAETISAGQTTRPPEIIIEICHSMIDVDHTYDYEINEHRQRCHRRRTAVVQCRTA